ncbi:DUF401 family protein [Megalodesulfovibrio gigas]|uniref:DUF401 family protein n=1 Tax=Megalodesulfovibrio gigas (strain ATCC 19364 / DSM 1382 / NCIMB 9332 / VKM B-1759) TaxID=1121448 RepID=T2GEE6_MEGG1|nr:DUF401 family protein [Megalodesulfovibrio gigas]AGW14501.1 putative protein of unknown function [Megalodesulfovibrio gigas DSM 1382 = ATCC 19364]
MALPLLKIILSFAVILLFLRLRIHLGLAILAGSAFLAVAFGHGVTFWCSNAVAGILDGQTLLLAAIVTSILIFSDVYEKSGMSGRLLESLQGMQRWPRVSLAFFPALIGLLPMPGGAIFSAPMIGHIGERVGAPVNDRALLNYWYRHIWELCWPLYPGIILASSLSGIPVLTLTAHMAVGPVACLLLGYLFFMRQGALTLAAHTPAAAAPFSWRTTGMNALPLAIAICGSVVLELLLSHVQWVTPELGILAALFAGIAYVQRSTRLPLALVRRAAFSKQNGVLLAIVGSIFIYKQMLAATGAISAISVSGAGLTTVLLCATLLPFLVGVVSGITMAFVGSTFPIILLTAQHVGLQEHTLAFVALGLFSGFVGVMISPLHICFVLSCQFFGVNSMTIWKRLVAPCMLLFAFGVAYFVILYWH